MANSFKTLLPEDVATTRTLLHEAIPITGTIASGTYSDENIKYFLKVSLKNRVSIKHEIIF